MEKLRGGFQVGFEFFHALAEKVDCLLVIYILQLAIADRTPEREVHCFLKGDWRGIPVYTGIQIVVALVF